jgi:hypothetical protein
MMGVLTGTLTAAALGPATVSLLDPQLGKRRRALARDRMFQAHRTADLAEKARRDLPKVDTRHEREGGAGSGGRGFERAAGGTSK